LPKDLPSGRDLQGYFDQVGLAPYKSAARVFDDVDDAKEWIENRILREAVFEHSEEKPIELIEIDVFKGRKVETLAAMESQLVKVSYKAGEKIFLHGSTGDELYIVRRGSVRFMLPVSDTQSHHLSTCGRGAFFGELAFLDGAPRTADAVALTDVDLFVLSRKAFDAFAEEHKKLAAKFFEGLASVLTGRVRNLASELQAMKS
jgi:SulP family sulfate permease